jgi:hypothetical protein
MMEYKHLTLENYYNNQLKPIRHCFRKLTNEQIMTFQSRLIDSPLLNIPQSLEDSACRMFKCIYS